MEKTIFVTYIFENEAFEPSKDYGFSTPIHCNYVTTLTADDLSGKRLSLFFDPSTLFTYMATSTSTNGTGFTATKMAALVQVVDGIGENIKPANDAWRKYDITDQIENHTVGDRIDPSNLKSTIFSIDINNNNGSDYDLSYLSYPLESETESENLSFGEETVFHGTVRTDIKARAYTTDIPINLSLNEYNSTTNPTWNGNEPVQITEIGIYDDENDLVAIGKLNYPISKNNTVARAIVFAIDF